LVLSEVAPISATALLSRARAFGESRVVCGVHNASAIEAAWITATSVFAAQNTSTEFHADIEAAKSELAGMRSAGAPLPEHCSEEATILAVRPY
jgi:acid phosphatase (class A)